MTRKNSRRGHQKAYDRLARLLKLYINEPAEIEEVIDYNLSSHFVKSRGVKYVIISPAVPEDGECAVQFAE